MASVFSALRVTPSSWVRVPSWHATATINSSSALGDNGFGPKRLAEHLTASSLGTAATVWSTALARDVGSSKMLAERLGSCWRALVRARLRLLSKFPLRDRSRSQFFVNEGVASGEVDEGESERLASSCRGWAHGAIVVPIAARRWAPRLLTSLRNDCPLVVDEEGYTYLV